MALLVRLVGYRHVDSEYEGKTYHRTRLYCEKLDDRKDNQVGSQVCEILVDDELNPPTFVLGDCYRIFFGQAKAFDGRVSQKVEYVVPVDHEQVEIELSLLAAPRF